MGKRPPKRIVLFLVEGKSDEEALFVPMSRLFDELDESIEVYFLRLEDEKQTDGDITSKYGIKPDNIERLIDQLFVRPFLKLNGFYSKDVLEIFHIVDIDGVYVDDVDVVQDDTCDKTLYLDRIYTNKVDDILERNFRKKSNIEHLLSLNQIKIDSKKRDYSIYYFSCNMDHFLHNDANLITRDKIQKAEDFSAKVSDSQEFINQFDENNLIGKDMDYLESWKFLKCDSNSLKRACNINVMLQHILKKYGHE